ncbi:P-loop containing nucleoside triphosphate hydrolase protein [Fusarium flagelliforme]|uniref:Nuclear gtp-binding protein nug1 n=1 Tax=Fusarium flagelliforme TaxID=2675880 RepID=A0A395MJI1_9HYPO|nr:P-loop containing nucleoside triphosphate hydrolase protein [Fusarium flagelliforme]KAH7197599.1 P-loop containing nucleoside triphosphate hydrolase protein [Fusarium flagelliforme]RFN48088.1 nuclear gtp-binding protein nug1 [Fusarium flagelliforme]
MAGSINKPKKPKSKRTPVRLRHKIQKASVAKQKKERKLAKKNPEWRTKLKKDPGIPNLFPYKEKLLQEIEENRIKKAELAQKRKELAKAAKTGTKDENAMADVEVDSADEMDDDDMDEDIDESNPMAALIASARAAAATYDRQLAEDDDMDSDDSDDSDNDRGPEMSIGQASSRKTYDRVFKQVVEEADVVLYVLDARDPEGTRSREVERQVMAAAAGGKRLILVINKVDLIPPKVLRDWLVYLRRYFPTLPLRASGAAPNAHTFNHRDLTVQSTSATLFKALKSFAASRQLKRAVSVGVIGYPNVGKSSVINALLSRMSGKGGSSSKACPAGAEAGVTTSIRSVKIDSKLTLLDSPGVVFPSSSSTQSAGLVSLKNATEAHAHLVLLNAVPPKQIDDPIPAVTLLLKRLSASPDLMQKLTNVYDIPALLPNRADGDFTTDFLVQVARKRGRLGRGGIPNLPAAAMTVVTDWRDGRIQGWVEPPVLAVESTATAAKPTIKNAGEDEVAADQKQIVTEWAAEFKLEGLWGDDSADVDDAMEQ